VGVAAGGAGVPVDGAQEVGRVVVATTGGMAGESAHFGSCPRVGLGPSAARS
jgi:hypothetical protein